MRLEDIGFYTLSDNRARNVSLTSPLWRCELLVTSKCNFNCPYCRGTDASADIPFEYAQTVVDLWAKDNLQNIRFSGGEPTCVEWLPDIIQYAKKSGIQRIAISTNGSRDIPYYETLIYCGGNDFSISLDACCSAFGDKMTGVEGAWENIIDNIRYLSHRTYVTVGCVFDENNVEQSIETVLLADSLGVSDIRILSSAQYNKVLNFMEKVPDMLLDKYPILKYRINNFKAGMNVRGIRKWDSHKCPLVMDDMAIKGWYHYPCIIHLREGGDPVGEVGKNMRKERFEFYKTHNTFEDEICRQNCLDVCVDYNNRVSVLNEWVAGVFQ